MIDFRFLFYRDTYRDTHRETKHAAAVQACPDSWREPFTDTGCESDWHYTLAALKRDTESPEMIRELTCRLVTFATEFGLYGNVWQQWITYMMMMHENAFTLACERRMVSQLSTMMRLAENDFALIRDLFSYDLRAHHDDPDLRLLAAMQDYRIPFAQETVSPEAKQIRMLAGRLARARDSKDFGRIAAEHYAEYGVGIYGLYRAFRLSDGAGAPHIVPVRETADVRFSDLVGYEEQKKILRENTEAFVRGYHANNVLLYGDSGTGKSTSVHALMHDYYGRGLRLVEITKQHRRLLPQVLSEIKMRNYRFIIYLDDLSFEENESDYKELKAMLEGALERREDRVLIYATSNRRHLIRETWGDRSDMEYNEDVHRSDTMEEKLSLASRFGVTIYYGKPDQKEYMKIVRTLSERKGIRLSGQELEDEARKWELRHGGMSGRTASQFVTWLEGHAASGRNK